MLRTWLLYLPLVVTSSALAASTWDSRRQGHGFIEAISGAGILVWLVGVALGVALGWRRRHPEVVTALAAVVTVLVPLDPVAVLIAFGSLTVRRLDRVVAGAGALTFVAVLVSTWRDGRGLSIESSFWQMVLSSSAEPGRLEPLSAWAVVAISLALTAIPFGVAMLIRDHARTRTTQAEGHAHRELVAGLNDELARQAERERLAQEVHDALGHRLSLLALHAGALQMRAGDDPAMRESADLVRWGAEQAMTDLRSLLTMLRQPGGPDVADSVPGLHDLALLIDEASRTGTTLISTVQLESLDDLDGLTSRSAFRIAQELLTNARRHAPRIGVRFLVRATPVTGVTIEAANHLPAGAAAEVEPGTGLTGIRTRVEQLGGRWRCWVDDRRVFRVAIHLPWVDRPDHDRRGAQGLEPVPWHVGQEVR
jgi:signal transduction histidine kinase